MAFTRLDHLAKQIDQAGLACLALVPGANLAYLTGLHFHLADRPTVAFFTPGQPPALVLPALEMQKLVEHPDWLAFPWTDEAGWEGAFRQAAAKLNLAGARIGVEAFTMRMVEVRILEGCARGAQLTPADNVPSILRMRKDAAELEHMRRAARIAEQALAQVWGAVRPGKTTERQLDQALRAALLQAGTEGLPFDPIVSSGSNTANPHAIPSDRVVSAGELLLFDWGAAAAGYASDITRTFPVGQVDPEFRRIYDVVLAANAAGREAVRPGVTCEAVDAAARKVIETAGYGPLFTHRTGHGLGLQGHEPPYIVAGNSLKLEPGMTFTVEPGIYLPGRGGVRIEDNMVVTEGGGESLTSFSREWAPIGV
jgi:Xaa-Pro dipeptidase